MKSETQKRQRAYTVGIVGAGRIAAGFDAPRSRVILTHAHAIRGNRRLALAGITDIDHARGAHEARKWGTDFYADMEAMLARVKPDIVVIATPDETHADVLLRAMRAAPRLIILEKPVASVREDAPAIREAARKSGVPVIINLSRRFDASMQQLRRDIAARRFGTVISATGIYTKGLVHNGSHMIDLARILFGEMKSCAPHFQKRDWEGDATVGGVASFERCPEFHLQTGDARAYAIFELDIVMEKGRVRIVDEGRTMITEDVIDDPLYKGFRILGKPRKEKTHLDRALPALYAHAVSVLDGEEPAVSSLEEALKTEEACRALEKRL